MQNRNATLETTSSNSISITSFLKNIRDPIKRAFSGQQFTVYGDVDTVNFWEGNLWVTLVDRSNGKPSTLKILILESVLQEYHCRVEADMRLLVTGTITTVRNEILLNAVFIQDIGQGKMLGQKEEWRETYRLYIDQPKKTIPFLCTKIAVISNHTSLGFIDFNKHLLYGNVDLWDTKMQGPSVAVDIAKAIKEINAQKEHDCICIVRGGGSNTDLFEFSKPPLLEAIGTSNIPVLTAIGHESDVPLCDAVADMRFSTPTDLSKYLTRQVQLLLGSVHSLSKDIRSNYTRIETKTNEEQRLRNGKIIAAAIIGFLLYTIYRLL